MLKKINQKKLRIISLIAGMVITLILIASLVWMTQNAKIGSASNNPSSMDDANGISSANENAVPEEESTSSLPNQPTPYNTLTNEPSLTPTSTPTVTPTNTPPAWAGFPGPTTTAVTEIPPPMPGIQLPSEVRVALLLATDTESPRVGRTDTIILVLYNPKMAKASLLSIPRDLMVYIPGFNMARINQAYPLGRMDLLSQTLEYNFNLVPENWLLIHLNDFVAFVDDLGGVEIYVPRALEDEHSSIPAGHHHLTGPQALWYVRVRQGSSDIDRNRRQHEMIQALTRKILRGGNLVHLPAWYTKYSKSIVTNFSLLDIINYIPLALQFGDQSRIQFQQIGWNDVTSFRTSEGASVLLPKRDHVQRLLENSLAFVMSPSTYADIAETLAAELTASPTPSAIYHPTHEKTIIDNTAKIIRDHSSAVNLFIIATK